MAKDAEARPIALFTPNLAGGGMQRVFADVANELARRELGVDLVVGDRSGPFADAFEPGVRVVDLNRKRLLTCLPGLRRYVERRRPRALHTGLEHANVVGALVARLGSEKCRFVAGVHNHMSTKFTRASGLAPKVVAWALPHALRRADAVVAVSRGVYDDLIERLGVPPEKTHLIYNPLPVAEITRAAARAPAHGWAAAKRRGEGPPLILTAGRLTAQKNQALLLEAFARLPRALDARLAILGEGELRAPLEAQARALGVHDRLIMPGFVADPFAWMARAEVFALSSDWEGLSMVLLEAMACGCKVVSTDCPSGPAEVIGDRPYGALTPCGDADALAGALETMLAAPPHAIDPAVEFAAFAPAEIARAYAELLTAEDDAPSRAGDHAS